MIETEPETEIYRDIISRKCWHKCSEVDGVVIVRRGNKTESHSTDDFQRMFEAVA